MFLSWWSSMVARHGVFGQKISGRILFSGVKKFWRGQKGRSSRAVLRSIDGS